MTNPTPPLTDFDISKPFDQQNTQGKLIQCLLACIGAIEKQNSAVTPYDLHEARSMRLSAMFTSKDLLKKIGVL